MDFAPSARAADLAARVRAFVDTEIEPVEPGILRDVAARRARGEDAWPPPAVVAELQAKARSQGLWNLFLPAGHGDAYAARFGTDGGTGPHQHRLRRRSPRRPAARRWRRWCSTATRPTPATWRCCCATARPSSSRSGSSRCSTGGCAARS